MEAKEEFYQELEEIGENEMDGDQDIDLGGENRVTDEEALNEDAMQNIMLDD